MKPFIQWMVQAKSHIGVFSNHSGKFHWKDEGVSVLYMQELYETCK